MRSKYDINEIMADPILEISNRKIEISGQFRIPEVSTLRYRCSIEISGSTGRQAHGFMLVA